MKKELKILVASPPLHLSGGVSEFVRLLAKEKKLHLDIFILKTIEKRSALSKLVWFWFDLFRFIKCLVKNKYPLVHINPSLGGNALLRDGLLTLIAKALKRKVYVHWHGWNPGKENLLKPPFVWFLKASLFRADHIRFLSPTFKDKIVAAGYKNSFSLGTTAVDDDLLKYDPHENDIKKPRNGCKLLFLATISINKGIYIMLEAFQALQKRFPDIRLDVAGDGPELHRAKQWIAQRNVPHVTFVGHADNDMKKNLYRQADVYCFPSFYEGMPTSLLEAMAFGLPVVATRVGAIGDFFRDGEMGVLVAPNQVEPLVDGLSELISRPESRKKMGELNKAFARERFLASKVMAEIIQEYKELLGAS